MQHNNYHEARKHLEKARGMAPSSPDIQYMMGMLDYPPAPPDQDH